MTGRLFLFRPEPGWSATARIARSEGFEVAGCPLFEIRPVDWLAPAPHSFDGLLIGSANVFRHAGDQLRSLRSLPVYAVGPKTAAAAQEAGFEVAMTGRAGMQELLNSLGDGPLRLLRPAGATRMALTSPPGISITDCAVYDSVPVELGAEVAGRLQRGGIVAVHSAEAAKRLDLELVKMQINRSGLDLIAFSQRIAEHSGLGWRTLHICNRPHDATMLALAKYLCQTRKEQG